MSVGLGVMFQIRILESQIRWQSLKRPVDKNASICIIVDRVSGSPHSEASFRILVDGVESIKTESEVPLYAIRAFREAQRREKTMRLKKGDIYCVCR